MTGLRLAVAMFTALPVPRRWHDNAQLRARAAVRWLPFVGAVLGGLAGLVASGVLARSAGAGLLAAALSVIALAVLTRGLHLDGLADTADGLGSGAPAERALAIMKQSDIGPFGVVAVACVLLVDVTALATAIGSDVWRAPAALAVSAATGRIAVVIACTAGVPAARPGGFGALVAGSVRPVVAGALTAALLAGTAGVAAAADASIAGWLATQVVALLIAGGLRVVCVVRLGGVTGDVFGALIEVTTAAMLVGIALS
ncbi:MAG TPA: adenosylcobinamide-GDP ribazoletransferase [Jatrophihabitantaceae bacterium]|nr:adenosylcobinamide-GDP ribazoletransferase [Jatrophihabitantaceae bacterium]